MDRASRFLAMPTRAFMQVRSPCQVTPAGAATPSRIRRLLALGCSCVALGCAATAGELTAPVARRYRDVTIGPLNPPPVTGCSVQGPGSQFDACMATIGVTSSFSPAGYRDSVQYSRGFGGGFTDHETVPGCYATDENGVPLIDSSNGDDYVPVAPTGRMTVTFSLPVQQVIVDGWACPPRFVGSIGSAMQASASSLDGDIKSASALADQQLFGSLNQAHVVFSSTQGLTSVTLEQTGRHHMSFVLTLSNPITDPPPAATERVALARIRDTIPPTVTVPPGLCDPRMLSIQKSTLRVSVTDANGQPVSNRRVRLSATAVDDDGGHVATEHASPRPAGSFATDIVVTDDKGEASVEYTRPEFAGRVLVTAVLPDVPTASPDVDTLVMGVTGLRRLAAGTTYELIGSDALHPDSHYGVPSLNSALTELADSVYSSMDHLVVGYNDMSLILGGRFDVTAKGALGGQWNASPNHCSHRRGDAADFRTRDLTVAQLKKVRKFWVLSQRHSFLIEGDHYHLKLSPPSNP